MFDWVDNFTEYLKNQFKDGANLIKIGISIIIILIAIVLIIVISKLHKKKKNKFNFQRTSAYNLSISIIRYAIIIIAILIVLQINGVDVSAMFASLGIITVIIGIGLKDVFLDFFSGTRIMTDKYFQIGDVVSYNGDEGYIEAFSLRTTKIHSTITGNCLIVSNRLLTQVQLVSRINDINLPLPYDMTLTEAEELLIKITNHASLIEHVDKCTYEGLVNFEDSAITYRVRYFCDPRVRIPTGRQVRCAILEVLNENHVSVPFNQLDIEIKNYNETEVENA